MTDSCIKKFCQKGLWKVIIFKTLIHFYKVAFWSFFLIEMKENPQFNFIIHNGKVTRIWHLVYFSIEFSYIVLDFITKMKQLSYIFLVLNDIVSTTFNRKFIHEIFIKHQPIYSKNVLRLMFDRLSNASTMRLYGESFDKVSIKILFSTTVHSVSCTRIVPVRIGPALGEP